MLKSLFANAFPPYNYEGLSGYKESKKDELDAKEALVKLDSTDPKVQLDIPKFVDGNLVEDSGKIDSTGNVNESIQHLPAPMEDIQISLKETSITVVAHVDATSGLITESTYRKNQNNETATTVDDKETKSNMGNMNNLKEAGSSATFNFSIEQTPGLHVPISQQGVSVTKPQHLTVKKDATVTLDEASLQDDLQQSAGGEVVDQATKRRRRRSAASVPNFLLKIAEVYSSENNQAVPRGVNRPSFDPPPIYPSITTLTDQKEDSTPHLSNVTPAREQQETKVAPSLASDADRTPKNTHRRLSLYSVVNLEPVAESDELPTSSTSKSARSSFIPTTTPGLDDAYVKKMQEAGRLRRAKSQQTMKEKENKHFSTVSSNTTDERSPSFSAEVGTPKDTRRASWARNNIQIQLQTPNNNGYPTETRKEQSSIHTAEVRSLRDRLDRALIELAESRQEVSRVKAANNAEKVQLAQRIQADKRELITLKTENASLQQKVSRLEAQLASTRVNLMTLTTEKSGWQMKLDTMSSQLQQAEKRVRCVDSLTRLKLEAREEGMFGKVKRTKKVPAYVNPSEEVVSLIQSLNEEILQSSNLLVENLQKSLVVSDSKDLQRCRIVLGDKLTFLLRQQALNGTRHFGFLLMQVVLEVFIVHWCTNIIEASYPERQTFADLLVDLSAKTNNNRTIPGIRVDYGKVKILQTDQISKTGDTNFTQWVTEILKDLRTIISVGSVIIGPFSVDIFTSKLLTLVKLAYDARISLAEKDICGGLELSVVKHGMPFQSKWMDEGHTTSRKKQQVASPTTSADQMDPIVGTCALGLQRWPASSSHLEAIPHMVVKPQVVLARVIEPEDHL